MDAPVASRFDRSAAALVGRAVRGDTAAMATIGVISIVAGAVVSDAALLSTALVGFGILLGVPTVWGRRDDLVVRLALAIGVVWVAYGALVGSLPAVTSLDEIRAWATTEGRVLAAVATMVVARGVRRTGDLRLMLQSIVWVATIGHLVSFVFRTVGWSLPGFEIELGNGLFVGLSSSHHVVGFISAVVVVVVLAVPAWFPRWSTWIPAAVALVSIGASGSRSALIGVVAGGVLIAIRRLGGRRAVLVGVAFAVVGAGYVASNQRFRTTVDVVTRPEFASEVRTAWGRGPERGIRDLSNSAAEANTLNRIRLWGIAWDGFADSPLIGVGVFRQNDDDLGFSGPRGMVYLATSGDKRFNDREPHNVVFFLLQEVGLAGLVLFATPYAVAWRSRRDEDVPPIGEVAADEVEGSSAPDGEVAFDPDTAAVLVHSMILLAIAISMVSSGVLATGLGLAANAVIFGACGEPPRARRGPESDPAAEVV